MAKMFWSLVLFLAAGELRGAEGYTNGVFVSPKVRFGITDDLDRSERTPLPLFFQDREVTASQRLYFIAVSEGPDTNLLLMNLKVPFAIRVYDTNGVDARRTEWGMRFNPVVVKPRKRGSASDWKALNPGSGQKWF